MKNAGGKLNIDIALYRGGLTSPLPSYPEGLHQDGR
jgi:hypothetical protein